jgi:hypothetical protein
MKKLKDAVQIIPSTIPGEFGCTLIHGCEEGSVIGTEVPVVAGPAFYSKRLIPSCDRCMHHSLRFSELITRLLTYEPSHSLDSEIRFSGNWFICSPCELILCPACAAYWRPSHDRYCVKECESKLITKKRLEKLCVAGSESWQLAFVWMARLISEGKNLDSDLFVSPHLQYFKRHYRPDPPELEEACVLMSERLGVTVPVRFLKQVVDTFDQTNLYLEIENSTMMEDLASETLPGELRAIHEQLQYPSLSLGDGYPPVPVAVGSGHYPTIALMNHSCDPNVEWRSVNGTACIELVALRPIAAGEELFLSYIDQSQSVDKRRSELERLYGFRCECTRCVLETSSR